MRKKGNLFYIILCTLLVTLGCKKGNDSLFQKVDANDSGITFVNEITENDSLNILDSEFVYNGAGVGIGDLNGDGLDDLFFTGNQVNNALYLNRGKLQFEDVTQAAKIIKPDTLVWSSGVSLVDLNLDGKLDIYICNTLRKDDGLRKNLLYINQGNDSKGTPSFQEMGAAYGIDDDSHSSHAQFFDYDNDGDLDLFVGVNLIEERFPNEFIKRKNDGSAPNRDNLFQNNWDEALGHPVFTDVSLAAGLLQDGYSHSTLIHDFNEDGWLDIYVANDYQSEDLIFINQQDGTFKDEAKQIFKHFSLSAMGSDVADINNDGRSDFFTSEMQPYYNKRKKLFQGESSYQREILTRRFDYQYQYTRNTLQLNQGVNPETQLPIYADIGMYAQVQETDWSWATLFADYDNDGWQDLYIVNGFPKDVTDRDFSDFRAYASKLVSKEKLLAAIPEVKSPNFMFRNQGDLTFEDKTKDWGMDIGTFSNGAAYGDLDQDGDLDLVINNIDDPILVFESKVAQATTKNHYLRLILTGPAKNPDAFGTTVEVYQGDMVQKRYILSGRGYLSKSENTVHFGLGDQTAVDSIRIIWPGAKVQTLASTEADQVLQVQFDATKVKEVSARRATAGLFQENAAAYGLDYKDRDIDFIDFNFQRTLPHKFSQYGPALAVGDIDQNGLEDIFIAGSRKASERWFLQQADQTFQEKEVNYKKSADQAEEDAGTLLFDADNDGDLDLYIVRGSAQYAPQDVFYQDVLLLNDGSGNFSEAPEALPVMKANGSCVKAADYDQDGDLDLFVGSRVLPYSYPMADRSYILKNESTNGQVKFVDATESINTDLLKPGLISDALWTDFNNDDWPDLILAGEWMSLRIFENKNGSLKEVTEASGLGDYQGWWNSLAAADLDNDGDTDYLAGNFGENLYFQCGSDTPLRIYAKDLDRNGSIDPLISCYWRDSLGNKNEYLYHPLQDVIKQFVGIRKKYNSFGEFGEATVPQMFAGIQMEDAKVMIANWMKTSWIENLGNGQFKVHALPIEAQLAPVYGILPIDLDGDTYQDILLIGNDFGMEMQQGRADAFSGLALKNEGHGNFTPLSLEASQFFVPGDGKSLVQLSSAANQQLILASQNNDQLKVFEQTTTETAEFIRPGKDEVKVVFEFLDGTKRVQEFYWGSSFQSQSSRWFKRPDKVRQMKFYTIKGELTRVVE